MTWTWLDRGEYFAKIGKNGYEALKKMVYLLPNLKNNCIFKPRAEGEGLNSNSMPRAEGEGINSNLHPEPKARV